MHPISDYVSQNKNFCVGSKQGQHKLGASYGKLIHHNLKLNNLGLWLHTVTKFSIQTKDQIILNWLTNYKRT